MQDPKIETLAETESYAVWTSEEAEGGEKVYHIELGNASLHLFEDEWAEFVELMMQAHR